MRTRTPFARITVDGRGDRPGFGYRAALEPRADEREVVERVDGAWTDDIVAAVTAGRR